MNDPCYRQRRCSCVADSNLARRAGPDQCAAEREITAEFDVTRCTHSAGRDRVNPDGVIARTATMSIVSDVPSQNSTIIHCPSLA